MTRSTVLTGLLRRVMAPGIKALCISALGISALGILALGIFALGIAPQPAAAQASHRKVLSDIALECLLPSLQSAVSGSVSVEGAGRAVIVAPELAQGLISKGFTLVTTGGDLKLAYNVEHASVALARKGRSDLTRDVALGLSFSINRLSDGAVMVSDTCRASRMDSVSREVVAALGDPAFPETNPTVPENKGLTRFLEPVVLIAATAVGTYLFFNLRSRRANSGQ